MARARLANRDSRRIRTAADELILRVVPFVRPGAAGRIDDASVPNAGLHAADRLRRVRDGAPTKILRS